MLHRRDQQVLALFTGARLLRRITDPFATLLLNWCSLVCVDNDNLNTS